MNVRISPPLKVLEAAFAPSAWAAGEDYVLQDRLQDLRRAGDSLAARVLGVRGDYWVRCTLDEPPLSACTCGRPRCRHAAALVQAYYARRLPAKDADAAIDAFLSRPRRAPLAAAILGEDLLDALRLPDDRLEDIATLPEAEEVLRLQEALQAAPDKASLLLAALPLGEAAGPMQDLLRAWLGELARDPANWLRFYAAAPAPLVAFLEAIEPPHWPSALHTAMLAALWQAAALGASPLARLAALAARRAPQEAYGALTALLPTHPHLLAPLFLAGESSGRAGRSLLFGLHFAVNLPAEQREDAYAAILAACIGHPKVRAEVLLRRAALRADPRALLAARRESLRAGNWPRLRKLVRDVLHGQKDAIALETRLLLADGDIEAAARAAAKCRTSSLPERLVADAMRSDDPAAARMHELRAAAIAQRLGEDGQHPTRHKSQEDRNPPRKD